VFLTLGWRSKIRCYVFLLLGWGSKIRYKCVLVDGLGKQGYIPISCDLTFSPYSTSTQFFILYYSEKSVQFLNPGKNWGNKLTSVNLKRQHISPHLTLLHVHLQSVTLEEVMCIIAPSVHIHFNFTENVYGAESGVF
jgi:hypothetical protein